MTGRVSKQRKPLWVLFLLLFPIGIAGCGSEKPSVTPDPTSNDSAQHDAVRASNAQQAHAEIDSALIAKLAPEVKNFCGDCHANPPASSSTSDEWPDEVAQGFDLYEASGRSDLKVPDRKLVLEYFQSLAPKKHAMPAHISKFPKAKGLRSSTVRFPSSRPPGITNVRWIDIGMHGSNALVYCDIGTGAVMAHWPMVTEKPTKRLATLLQPVHTEPCDLNQDGKMDLVVADIGEFNAEDSSLGRIVWLRRRPDSEKFDRVVLLDGLSRVADVQPGDFDGDEDLDLLVGVFGWRKTGAILLLENLGFGDDGKPNFKPRKVDTRAGAVNVSPVDLDGDGDLDFVALISQHHEVVEAFFNDGKGSFEIKRVWAAPDPAYGSSGIELCDLDGDSDLDVLYTNGDSFDRGLKPYHSVQWLENEGSFPYKHHKLIQFPGALNAKAGDIDGDGDMDIVATSKIAQPEVDKHNFGATPSIVLLRQIAPRQFAPETIEEGAHHHLSIEMGDFNADGKLDIASGTFLRSGDSKKPDLVLWINEP